MSTGNTREPAAQASPETVSLLGGGVAPLIGGGQVDGSGLSAPQLDDLLFRGYQVRSSSTGPQEITQADTLISEAEFFVRYGCRRPAPVLSLSDQLRALPRGARPRIRHVHIREDGTGRPAA
jgi:hypothetical protein